MAFCQPFIQVVEKSKDQIKNIEQNKKVFEEKSRNDKQDKQIRTDHPYIEIADEKIDAVKSKIADHQNGKKDVEKQNEKVV